MIFNSLYDRIMTVKTRKAGRITYKRDPATNLWVDNHGNRFTLDDHGEGRIDMVPVAETV